MIIKIIPAHRARFIPETEDMRYENCRKATDQIRRRIQKPVKVSSTSFLNFSKE